MNELLDMAAIAAAEIFTDEDEKLKKDTSDVAEPPVEPIPVAQYPSEVTQGYFENLETFQMEGNSGLKKQIELNVIQAEIARAPEYEQVAAEMGISVEYLKRLLQFEIKRMTLTSGFFKAMTVDTLEAVLKGGRFKTQFETNQSGGILDLEARAISELKMFGFNRNEAHAKEVIESNRESRPVYGYLSSGQHGELKTDLEGDQPNWNTSSYGAVTMEFDRTKVLKKTTVTVDDSLGQEDIVSATPAIEPHFTSLKPGVENMRDVLSGRTNSNKPDFGGKYIEVQYHNQLYLSDASIIHISEKNGMTPEEIVRVKNAYAEFKINNPDSPLRLVEY